MQGTLGDTRTPNCLIVESSRLVAEDMSETVREIWRDAAVQSFFDAGAAADWLNRSERIDIAICSPQGREYAPLVARLLNSGCGVVLTSDEPLEQVPASANAIVVARPFTSTMLTDALRSIVFGDRATAA